jgi:hypothetical protein
VSTLTSVLDRRSVISCKAISQVVKRGVVFQLRIDPSALSTEGPAMMIGPDPGGIGK